MKLIFVGPYTCKEEDRVEIVVLVVDWVCLVIGTRSVISFVTTPNVRQ